MRQAFEPAREFVPNLAPMVDVIMVLLVFFLLGASFNMAEQGVLTTQLDPRSGPQGGAGVQINPRVVITLGDVRDGQAVQVALVGQALGENAFGALYDTLAARRAQGADDENPLVIAADVNVRWDFVVRAMDAATRAGFKNIQFSVSLPAAAP